MSTYEKGAPSITLSTYFSFNQAPYKEKGFLVCHKQWMLCICPYTMESTLFGPVVSVMGDQGTTLWRLQQKQSRVPLLTKFTSNHYKYDIIITKLTLKISLLLSLKLNYQCKV